MIAELAWRNKEANGGKFSKEFLDDFFARGISDKCFNEKFRELTLFHLDWMSKFDGAETTEETATRNVVEGKYGEALKHKGPVLALKEAYDLRKLLEYLTTAYEETYGCDLKVNNQTVDQWIQDIMPVCIALLRKQGTWESALYRSGEDREYFLLDERTLVLFLKATYHYLKL